MLYPEAALLPVLMQADYLLTVAGASARQGAYSTHFKLEQYELNPTWQKDIARLRWFNPKHLLMTTALSGAVIAVFERRMVPEPWASFVLGALLGVFAAIVGRHLNNLLVFHHVATRPGDVTGTVTLSHGFVLSTSLYQMIMVFVPITLLAAVSGHPLVLGAMVGFWIAWRGASPVDARRQPGVNELRAARTRTRRRLRRSGPGRGRRAPRRGA